MHLTDSPRRFLARKASLVKTVTQCPSSIRRREKTDPISPVAPVINTFIFYGKSKSCASEKNFYFLYAIKAKFKPISGSLIYFSTVFFRTIKYEVLLVCHFIFRNRTFCGICIIFNASRLPSALVSAFKQVCRNARRMGFCGCMERNICVVWNFDCNNRRLRISKKGILCARICGYSGS